MTPSFLKPNDQIAIVSPSGIVDEKYIDKAVDLFKSWSLDPIVGKYAKGKEGRFSGTIEQRVADFQEALDNKKVKAIFCSRGGYGLMQIIDYIDFTQFEVAPKWIIGYSDITILHTVASSLDVVSLHAHMARQLTDENTDAQIVQDVHDVLFGSYPSYKIAAHELNRLGEARGQLVGGNMSVLYGLRGTHFDMDSYRKILFIEDIGEDPYKVDRMLQNFKMGGILENIEGLIVGQFTDYEEDPLMGNTVYELIANAVSEYDFPVCFNFPVGHVSNNVPLLVGADVDLIVGETVELSFD